MLIQNRLWFLIIYSLFLLACAFPIQNLTNDYPIDKISQIENSKWLIGGKISYTNFENYRQNFSGSFNWQSENGRFKINFYNQITNQSFFITGSYFNPPIKLIEVNQIFEFEDLNQILSQLIGLSINWQDLIFWLSYQMPQSAQSQSFNNHNELISFDYQNLKIEYLSFFDPPNKKKKAEFNQKVKLIKITEFQQNIPVHLVKIAIQNYQFNF